MACFWRVWRLKVGLRKQSRLRWSEDLLVVSTFIPELRLTVQVGDSTASALQLP